jgi:hypothetical protein
MLYFPRAVPASAERETVRGAGKVAFAADRRMREASPQSDDVVAG